MSTAGMGVYQREGRCALKEAVANRRPVFVLANVHQLNLAYEEPVKSLGAGVSLREQDWVALKSHFVHHWGPVWVAGKQFHLTPESSTQSFETLIPGPYTIEGNADIVIDGELHRCGDVIILQKGIHVIEAGGERETIQLRWGDHLYRPKDEPPWDSVFARPLG